MLARTYSVRLCVYSTDIPTWLLVVPTMPPFARVVLLRLLLVISAIKIGKKKKDISLRKITELGCSAAWVEPFMARGDEENLPLFITNNITILPKHKGIINLFYLFNIILTVLHQYTFQ